MLSIIIPTYNSSKYIIRCINSIISQSTKLEYEIIVVNDGSTDNTEEVLSNIGDNRVICYHKKNGGVSIARNFGMEKSNGEYLTFIDSDDYISKNYFSTIEHLLGAYDLICFGYNAINGRKKIEYSYNVDLFKISDLNENFNYLFKFCFFNPVWNKIYKRDLIKDGFEINQRLGEDLIFNLNYLRNANTVKNIKDPLYNYCINSTSVTKNYQDNSIIDYIGMYSKTIDFTNGFNIVNYESVFLNFSNDIIGSIQLLVESETISLEKKFLELENINRCIKKADFSKQIFKQKKIVIRMLNREFYLFIYLFFYMKKKLRVIKQKLFK